MPPITLTTLDPGHFHAALIQKEMYANISPVAHVYAPLGSDLIEHLHRVSRFNNRPANPTAWELEVHASPHPLERMLAERLGNVVVLSGRNRGKIDRILASVQAGLHVLADKPWIVEPEDLPKLAAALDIARRDRLVAFDIMTERHEITSILQRELVADAAVFGEPVAGAAGEPGVYMESVHHLLKRVAGVPNLRPAWFFDIREQGEALADVGTHLVDLVQWTLFPGQAIDCTSDLRLIAASRWPTTLSPADFARVTGETRAEPLDYYCNTRVTYAIRGVVVRLDVLWNYEAAAGAGDTHYAVYRGTHARIEVRQGAAENYRPELYVVPSTPGGAWEGALRRRIEDLAHTWPGLTLDRRGDQWLIGIPERYRIGHEAHFAQVVRQFLGYLENPAAMPAWEEPGMLAKYWVCTKGVDLSRRPGASSTTPPAGGPAPGADSARSS